MEGENCQDTERKRLNEEDSPLETTEGEICQGIEGKQPNEGHSPLETTEGEIRQDIIRNRPSKALVQVHRDAGMSKSEAFRED
jgi:hypothetical protein